MKIPMHVQLSAHTEISNSGTWGQPLTKSQGLTMQSRSACEAVGRGNQQRDGAGASSVLAVSATPLGVQHGCWQPSVLNHRCRHTALHAGNKQHYLRRQKEKKEGRQSSHGSCWGRLCKCNTSQETRIQLMRKIRNPKSRLLMLTEMSPPKSCPWSKVWWTQFSTVSLSLWVAILHCWWLSEWVISSGCVFSPSRQQVHHL